MSGTDFEIFSRSIRGSLVALAHRFYRASGGSDEAEDVAQEALVALWKLSESGYPIRDAKALTVRITKNICISRYRKRKVETLPLTGDQYPGGVPASALTDARDESLVKERLMAGLTETQRTLVRMRNFSGMSLDEIAAATRKPKASVKVTLSTARKKMLESIKEDL